MRARGHGNVAPMLNLEYAQPADDTARASTRLAALFLSAVRGGLCRRGCSRGWAAHADGWRDNFKPWPARRLAQHQLLHPQAMTGHGRATAVRARCPRPSGVEIYPEGLRFFPERCTREYSGDLPIYVTERRRPPTPTGSMGAAPTTVFSPDTAEVRRAARRPVAGYFGLGGCDNYEWALGYDKRFGLVRVRLKSPRAHAQGLTGALTRRCARRLVATWPRHPASRGRAFCAQGGWQLPTPRRPAQHAAGLPGRARRRVLRGGVRGGGRPGPRQRRDTNQISLDHQAASVAEASARDPPSRCSTTCRRRATR